MLDLETAYRAAYLALKSVLGGRHPRAAAVLAGSLRGFLAEEAAMAGAVAALREALPILLRHGDGDAVAVAHLAVASLLPHGWTPPGHAKAPEADADEVPAATPSADPLVSEDGDPPPSDEGASEGGDAVATGKPKRRKAGPAKP
jgi:hypothetical protein